MKNIVIAILLGACSSGWGQTTATSHVTMSRSVRDVAPGPWGRVRYVPLQISPPAAAVRGFLEETQEIRWFVMLRTREEVGTLLLNVGLDPDAVKGLLTRGGPTVDGRGWLLLPPPELVLGLPSDVRKRLYTALGQWQENPRHRSPFRLVDHASRDWREMAGLDDAVQARFERLVYDRGSLKVFTDLPLMLIAMKSSTAVQMRFLRSVCSESTYLATLRVLPEDDVDALARYWGVGGREEEVRPLIEAAGRAQGEIGVPLPLLLPGFPRQVLYTYAPPEDMRFLDCHYSSINFFNREADPRLLQGLYRDTFFNAFYEEVPEAGQLGDIMVMLSPSGEVVHSCVFLAGELVFTKNGGQRTLPWMLMTLGDLKEYFSTEGELTLRAYRRRANAE